MVLYLGTLLSLLGKAGTLLKGLGAAKGATGLAAKGAEAGATGGGGGGLLGGLLGGAKGPAPVQVAGPGAPTPALGASISKPAAGAPPLLPPSRRPGLPPTAGAQGPGFLGGRRPTPAHMMTANTARSPAQALGRSMDAGAAGPMRRPGPPPGASGERWLSEAKPEPKPDGPGAFDRLLYGSSADQLSAADRSAGRLSFWSGALTGKPLAGITSARAGARASADWTKAQQGRKAATASINRRLHAIDKLVPDPSDPGGTRKIRDPNQAGPPAITDPVRREELEQMRTGLTSYRRPSPPAAARYQRFPLPGGMEQMQRIEGNQPPQPHGEPYRRGTRREGPTGQQQADARPIRSARKQVIELINAGKKVEDFEFGYPGIWKLANEAIVGETSAEWERFDRAVRGAGRGGYKVPASEEGHWAELEGLYGSP